MIDRAYLERLVEATPVDLYASGIDGARAYWPWRMNKARSPMGHGARKSHARKCDHYILDSNFKDDTVTNKDVLDEAAELFADGAVLADVYHDMEATAEALIEGLELAREHPFDGTIVLPLQEPHDECYRRVAPHVDREVWWSVGGVKDKTPAVKIACARELREVAGPDVHIHGLGFGVTEHVARAIRNNPDLLDSIDNSSSVSNGIPQLSGVEEKMTITAAEATAARLKDLRALTSFADDRPAAELRDAGQGGLEVFHGAD
ncbi:hypothetical protein [Halosolutus gelatinilyticus]|uniref:hypothetical protein n=1 Tax=Halosolutus gelatinilyticus TaxID=2931975 RepID=UPI001FF58A8F|nr:hypothetical protein [Halosolutus gelatinilyticus]